MPRKTRPDKTRAAFTPANPVAARLELIRGRSPLIEYHDDHITRPSNFPDALAKRFWFEQIRESLLDYWTRTGSKPAAFTEFEPDLGGPGQPGGDAAAPHPTHADSSVSSMRGTR